MMDETRKCLTLNVQHNIVDGLVCNSSSIDILGWYVGQQTNLKYIWQVGNETQQ